MWQSRKVMLLFLEPPMEPMVSPMPEASMRSNSMSLEPSLTAMQSSWFQTEQSWM